MATCSNTAPVTTAAGSNGTTIELQPTNAMVKPSTLAFAAGPGIRQLISGELTANRAIATGVVEVLRGRGALLGRFAETFHLAA